MGEKNEYVQLTIRLPRTFYNRILEKRRNWGTSIQDTFLIILYRYFLEVDDND